MSLKQPPPTTGAFTELAPDRQSKTGALRADTLHLAAADLWDHLLAAGGNGALMPHARLTKDGATLFFPNGDHFVEVRPSVAYTWLVELLTALNVRFTAGQVKTILDTLAMRADTSWDRDTPHPADAQQVVFALTPQGLVGSTTYPAAVLPTAHGVCTLPDGTRWVRVGSEVLMARGAGHARAPEFLLWLRERWPTWPRALETAAVCAVLGRLGLGGAAECALQLKGASGGGKSTFAEIFMRGCGPGSIMRLTPTSINDPLFRYEVARARWAVLDDDSFGYEGIDNLKLLLSPSPLLQRTHYTRPTETSSRALYVFAANQLPGFRNQAFDDSLYRRLALCPEPVPVPKAKRVDKWLDGLWAREGEGIFNLLWDVGWPVVEAWLRGVGKLFGGVYSLPETRHNWLMNSNHFYRDVLAARYVADAGAPAMNTKALWFEFSTDRAFERSVWTRGNLGYLLQALAMKEECTREYPDTMTGLRKV